MNPSKQRDLMSLAKCDDRRDGVAKEKSAVMALPGADETAPTDEQVTEQLVVMRLGGEDYGLGIISVQEIIRMQNITKVPQAPPYVEGIINLRGSVIPVIDLRARFNLAASENSADTRIVVVEVEGNTVGLVVDAVTEVITVESKAIEPVGNLAGASATSDLRGIVNLPEKLIILISLETLIESVAGFDLAEPAKAA